MVPYVVSKERIGCLAVIFAYMKVNTMQVSLRAMLNESPRDVVVHVRALTFFVNRPDTELRTQALQLFRLDFLSNHCKSYRFVISHPAELIP
jgi:hypothetical protein